MRIESIRCGFCIIFCYNFAVVKRLAGMNNSSIKKNIRHFRKAKGYTQEEMAKKIGMSETHYRNIEKGSTVLISPVVGKIAEALGLSEDALILGPMTDIHDVLEDEEVPYMTQNAYLTNRLRIAEDALSEYQAKNKSLERDISEKELSIEDLRSAVRILKRAKGFENPEKI